MYRAKRLFENPDTCCRSGKYDNFNTCADHFERPLKYYDNKSHGFGYYEGLMVFGPEGMFHPNISVGGRLNFKYAGRIWIKDKIITFWDYPPTNRIKSVLSDLDEAFREANCMYMDRLVEPHDVAGIYDEVYYNEPKNLNILKSKYMIEVMKGTPAYKNFNKKDWGTEIADTEFITIDEYAGRQEVHERPAKDMEIEHMDSPLQKKQREIPKGTGSKKYGEKKPIKYRQMAMTSEGVGDRFAERKFNIPNPDEVLNKQIRAINVQKENIIWIYDINGNEHPVVINPTSLKNIEAEARGIIDKKGNIYVHNNPAFLTHTMIIDMLIDVGHLQKTSSKEIEDWHEMRPENIFTVQRFSNTKYFCIGESNEFKYYEKYLDTYREWMERANKMNPGIGFILWPVDRMENHQMIDRIRNENLIIE